MEYLVADIICSIFIFVLLLSISLQKIKTDKTASRFSLLAHTVLGFLLTDTVCTLVNGKPEFNVLAYVANTMDYLWIDVIIIAFSAYLSILVGRVNKKWEKVMNPAVVFTYLRIAVIIVLAACGRLFVIDENGYFCEQSLSSVPYAMMFAILVMLALVIIRNKPYFSTRQTAVMLVYLALPFCASVFEFITNVYIALPISITVSVLVIYTMVQSSIIEEGRVRESVLEEISSTDLLTKLNNRRAYYHRFAVLPPEGSVGVVFCDINGLKSTNDRYGHAAGDRLIIRFSAILTETFDPGDIFRISGDEFVAVIPAISQADFEAKVQNLQKAITDNGSIAAIGSAFGTGDSVEQLVMAAESSMYRNKREYYAQNNIQRGDGI